MREDKNSPIATSEMLETEVILMPFLPYTLPPRTLEKANVAIKMENGREAKKELRHRDSSSGLYALNA